MAKSPRRPKSADEELSIAYGLSLLAELVHTYEAWRHANVGKCSWAEVANALAYFYGGAMAEIVQQSGLLRRMSWEEAIQRVQTQVASAVTHCREHVTNRRSL